MMLNIREMQTFVVSKYLIDSKLKVDLILMPVPNYLAYQMEVVFNILHSNLGRNLFYEH